MSKISSEKHLEKEPHAGLIPSQKHARKRSLNSSSDSDSFFINIKKDIKALLENDENISISSNSEEDSQNKNEELDYLLESRFWKPKKYNEINKEKIKKEKGIREESNKQSTQENEDEEIRNEQINNNSSSESNNSPYNEANDNERNFDKNNHYLNNEKKDEKNKINNNINIINNNNDKNNLNGTNILLNGSNFANNINYKNMNGYSKFIFPYDHINYINNQNLPNFFSNSYLNKNYPNYNTNYTIPTPLETKNIIQNNTNNVSKLSKLLNEKRPEPKQEEKSNNKEIINNKQNNTKIPVNYNTPKLNINMTYNPNLPSLNNNPNNKQTETKVNNVSSELKNALNKSNTTPQEKKPKTTNINEIKNNSNNTNKNTNTKKIVEQNYNNKSNIDNNINNNNSSNFNTKNSKCEKLILNLDDIASGKDTRTTIMIRNIPIKYTDNILNDTFKEFHGKYDCLYMPYDHEKKGNKGYAFINFVNALHILLFYEKFNGKKWIHFESPKICELNMAHFQGINEIQKHAKNFKELKKSCFKSNEKIVIPSKYLMKLKKRFPKMKYSENSKKNEFEILSFN